MFTRATLFCAFIFVHYAHAQYGGAGYAGYGNGMAGGDGGDGGGTGRKHIKLNLGIHVPNVVVKFPRIQMPRVTIKANFIKKPNAKPLELSLPPPPSISFGDDGSNGGGMNGGGGGGGDYGNGGYQQQYGGGYSGGGYGGGGHSQTALNLQKSIKIESENNGGYGNGYQQQSYGQDSSYGGGYQQQYDMPQYPQAYADSAPKPQTLGSIPYIEAKGSESKNLVQPSVAQPAPDSQANYPQLPPPMPFALPPPEALGLPPQPQPGPYGPPNFYTPPMHPAQFGMRLSPPSRQPNHSNKRKA